MELGPQQPLPIEARLRAIGIQKDTAPRSVELATTFVGMLKENFDQSNQAKITDALVLMAELHKDQKPRPDGPYMDHPLAVATNVLAHMAEKDPEIVIAALLHDTVEDQASKLADKATNPQEGASTEETALGVIEEKYGPGVRETVAALSNPDFEESKFWRVSMRLA